MVSLKLDKSGVYYKNPYEDPDYLHFKNVYRENNCCTVVALWQATGNSLDQCRDYMAKFGRKHRKGMTRQEWNSALESMKKFKVKKGAYNQRDRVTVKTFIDKHPVGTYYVANNGHAFVIKDGVIHDHTVGLRRQITCAYRVYSQCELHNFKEDAFNSKIKKGLTEFEKGILFSASLLYSYWGNADQAITLLTETGMCNADISGMGEYDVEKLVQIMAEYPDRVNFTTKC